MPRNTSQDARSPERAVDKVTAIELDNHLVLRYDVAPTEEHSAEVEMPRSLFAEVQHLVQADELAVLVLLTAGAPQLSRQGVGTKWAEVLGCGSTVVGILDKLCEMSPQLVIEERQFRSVLAKIEDARRSTSTDRPRIVGGVRWTPKELACVHVDAAAASPGRGGPSGGDTAAVVSAVNEHLAAAEHTHSTAGLRGCIANSVGYVFCSMGRTGKLTEREILAVLVHCGQRYHAGKRPFEPDLRGQEFIKMLQCT